MMEALFSGKERKCMWNRSYNVIMRTPIGARYGTVSVTVDNSTISGMLDILKKANPFHGNINRKGRLPDQRGVDNADANHPL